MAIQKYTDLDVYNLAEDVAMEIFYLTSKFPVEENWEQRVATKDPLIEQSKSPLEIWVNKY